MNANLVDYFIVKDENRKVEATKRIVLVKTVIKVEKNDIADKNVFQKLKRVIELEVVDNLKRVIEVVNADVVNVSVENNQIIILLVGEEKIIF